MTVDVVSIILPELDTYTSFAQNFAKSRFLINASEYNTNEKEAEELNKISEGIRCELTSDGSSVSLSILYDDNNEYLHIIQKGMEAPLTGGDNGIATNPDGTQYHSKVPKQLWGNEIESYAKPAEDVKGEVKMMLHDLFMQRVQEVISENKVEIAKQIKPYIEKEIQSILR